MDALSTYLPQIVIQFLEQNADRHKSGQSANIQIQYVEGAIFFADISGFTSISEFIVSNSGTDEQLAKHLNSYFEQLTRTISSNNGIIMRFLGDAVLVLFPSQNDTNLAICTRRAAQCALEVKDKLADFCISLHGRATDLKLDIKVGIGVGSMSVIHVGGVFGRMEYILTGDPLIQCFKAESKANNEQSVVSSPEVWQYLQDYFTGTVQKAADNSTYIYLSACNVPLRKEKDMHKQIRAPMLTPSVKQLMKQYIPGAVIPWVTCGEERFASQLLRATVLFIQSGLSGSQFVSKPTHDEILHTHKVLRSVQSAVYLFEGSINKFILDDKGATLIAIFGLPPLAHENDPIRGVLSAMAIVSSLRALGLSPSVGVTTGNLFCGILGSRGRREYSVLGDTVNLAARLMVYASQNRFPVIVDGATMMASRGQIFYQECPKLHVKGKKQPVLPFRPFPISLNRLYATLGTTNDSVQRHPPALVRNGFLLPLASGLNQFAGLNQSGARGLTSPTAVDSATKGRSGQFPIISSQHSQASHSHSHSQNQSSSSSSSPSLFDHSSLNHAPTASAYGSPTMSVYGQSASTLFQSPSSAPMQSPTLSSQSIDPLHRLLQHKPMQREPTYIICRLFPTSPTIGPLQGVFGTSLPFIAQNGDMQTKEQEYVIVFAVGNNCTSGINYFKSPHMLKQPEVINPQSSDETLSSSAASAPGHGGHPIYHPDAIITNPYLPGGLRYEFAVTETLYHPIMLVKPPTDLQYLTDNVALLNNGSNSNAKGGGNGHGNPPAAPASGSQGGASRHLPYLRDLTSGGHGHTAVSLLRSLKNNHLHSSHSSVGSSTGGSSSDQQSNGGSNTDKGASGMPNPLLASSLYSFDQSTIDMGHKALYIATPQQYLFAFNILRSLPELAQVMNMYFYTRGPPVGPTGAQLTTTAPQTGQLEMPGKKGPPPGLQISLGESRGGSQPPKLIASSKAAARLGIDVNPTSTSLPPNSLGKLLTSSAHTTFQSIASPSSSHTPEQRPTDFFPTISHLSVYISRPIVKDSQRVAVPYTSLNSPYSSLLPPTVITGNDGITPQSKSKTDHQHVQLELSELTRKGITTVGKLLALIAHMYSIPPPEPTPGLEEEDASPHTQPLYPSLMSLVSAGCARSPNSVAQTRVLPVNSLAPISTTSTSNSGHLTLGSPPATMSGSGIRASQLPSSAGNHSSNSDLSERNSMSLRASSQHPLTLIRTTMTSSLNDNTNTTEDENSMLVSSSSASGSATGPAGSNTKQRAVDTSGSTQPINPVRHLALTVTLSHLNNIAIEELSRVNTIVKHRYQHSHHTTPITLPHFLPLTYLQPLLHAQNARTALLTAQPVGGGGSLMFASNSVLSLRVEYSAVPQVDVRYLASVRDRIISSTLRHIGEVSVRSSLLDMYPHPSGHHDDSSSSSLSSTSTTSIPSPIAFSAHFIPTPRGHKSRGFNFASTTPTSAAASSRGFFPPGSHNEPVASADNDNDDQFAVNGPTDGDQNSIGLVSGDYTLHLNNSIPLSKSLRFKDHYVYPSINLALNPEGYRDLSFTTSLAPSPRPTSKGLAVLIEGDVGVGKTLLLNMLKNETILPSIQLSATQLDPRPLAPIGSILWQFLEQEVAVYETLFSLSEHFWPSRRSSPPSPMSSSRSSASTAMHSPSFRSVHSPIMSPTTPPLHSMLADGKASALSPAFKGASGAPAGRAEYPSAVNHARSMLNGSHSGKSHEQFRQHQSMLLPPPSPTTKDNYQQHSNSVSLRKPTVGNAPLVSLFTPPGGGNSDSVSATASPPLRPISSGIQHYPRWDQRILQDIAMFKREKPAVFCDPFEPAEPLSLAGDDLRPISSSTVTTSKSSQPYPNLPSIGHRLSTDAVHSISRQDPTLGGDGEAVQITNIPPDNCSNDSVDDGGDPFSLLMHYEFKNSEFDQETHLSILQNATCIRRLIVAARLKALFTAHPVVIDYYPHEHFSGLDMNQAGGDPHRLSLNSRGSNHSSHRGRISVTSMNRGVNESNTAHSAAVMVDEDHSAHTGGGNIKSTGVAPVSPLKELDRISSSSDLHDHQHRSRNISPCDPQLRRRSLSSYGRASFEEEPVHLVLSGDNVVDYLPLMNIVLPELDYPVTATSCMVLSDNLRHAIVKEFFYAWSNYMCHHTPIPETFDDCVGNLAIVRKAFAQYADLKRSPVNYGQPLQQHEIFCPPSFTPSRPGMIGLSLIIDNGNHLDELSWDFLAGLPTRVPSLVSLVATRPINRLNLGAFVKRPPPGYLALRDDPDTCRIVLGNRSQPLAWSVFANILLNVSLREVETGQDHNNTAYGHVFDGDINSNNTNTTSNSSSVIRPDSKNPKMDLSSMTNTAASSNGRGGSGTPYTPNAHVRFEIEYIPYSHRVRIPYSQHAIDNTASPEAIIVMSTACDLHIANPENIITQISTPLRMYLLNLQGNPEFIKQILLGLKRSRLIELVHLHMLQLDECFKETMVFFEKAYPRVPINIRLPYRIQSILGALLDRLNLNQLMIVKIAAIVGSFFTFNLIASAFPTSFELIPYHDTTGSSNMTPSSPESSGTLEQSSGPRASIPTGVGAQNSANPAFHLSQQQQQYAGYRNAVLAKEFDHLVNLNILDPIYPGSSDYQALLQFGPFLSDIGDKEAILALKLHDQAHRNRVFIHDALYGESASLVNNDRSGRNINNTRRSSIVEGHFGIGKYDYSRGKTGPHGEDGSTPDQTYRFKRQPFEVVYRFSQHFTRTILLSRMLHDHKNIIKDRIHTALDSDPDRVLSSLPVNLQLVQDGDNLFAATVCQTTPTVIASVADVDVLGVVASKTNIPIRRTLPPQKPVTYTEITVSSNPFGPVDLHQEFLIAKQRPSAAFHGDQWKSRYVALHRHAITLWESQDDFARFVAFVISNESAVHTINQLDSVFNPRQVIQRSDSDLEQRIAEHLSHPLDARKMAKDGGLSPIAVLFLNNLEINKIVESEHDYPQLVMTSTCWFKRGKIFTRDTRQFIFASDTASDFDEWSTQIDIYRHALAYDAKADISQRVMRDTLRQLIIEERDKRVTYTPHEKEAHERELLASISHQYNPQLLLPNIRGNQSVLYEGEMFCHKHSGLFGSRWKKRHVTLLPTTLQFRYIQPPANASTNGKGKGLSSHGRSHSNVSNHTSGDSSRSAGKQPLQIASLSVGNVSVTAIEQGRKPALELKADFWYKKGTVKWVPRTFILAFDSIDERNEWQNRIADCIRENVIKRIEQKFQDSVNDSYDQSTGGGRSSQIFTKTPGGGISTGYNQLQSSQLDDINLMKHRTSLIIGKKQTFSRGGHQHQGRNHSGGGAGLASSSTSKPKHARTKRDSTSKSVTTGPTSESHPVEHEDAPPAAAIAVPAAVATSAKRLPPPIPKQGAKDTPVDHKHPNLEIPSPADILFSRPPDDDDENENDHDINRRRRLDDDTEDIEENTVETVQDLVKHWSHGPTHSMRLFNPIINTPYPYMDDQYYSYYDQFFSSDTSDDYDDDDRSEDPTISSGNRRLHAHLGELHEIQPLSSSHGHIKPLGSQQSHDALPTPGSHSVAAIGSGDIAPRLQSTEFLDDEDLITCIRDADVADIAVGENISVDPMASRVNTITKGVHDSKHGFCAFCGAFGSHVVFCPYKLNLSESSNSNLGQGTGFMYDDECVTGDDYVKVSDLIAPNSPSMKNSQHGQTATVRPPASTISSISSSSARSGPVGRDDHRAEATSPLFHSAIPVKPRTSVASSSTTGSQGGGTSSRHRPMTSPQSHTKSVKGIGSASQTNTNDVYSSQSTYQRYRRVKRLLNLRTDALLSVLDNSAMLFERAEALNHHMDAQLQQTIQPESLTSPTHNDPPRLHDAKEEGVWLSSHAYDELVEANLQLRQQLQAYQEHTTHIINQFHCGHLLSCLNATPFYEGEDSVNSPSSSSRHMSVGGGGDSGSFHHHQRNASLSSPYLNPPEGLQQHSSLTTLATSSSMLSTSNGVVALNIDDTGSDGQVHPHNLLLSPRRRSRHTSRVSLYTPNHTSAPHTSSFPSAEHPSTSLAAAGPLTAHVVAEGSGSGGFRRTTVFNFDQTSDHHPNHIINEAEAEDEDDDSERRDDMSRSSRRQQMRKSSTRSVARTPPFKAGSLPSGASIPTLIAPAHHSSANSVATADSTRGVSVSNHHAHHHRLSTGMLPGSSRRGSGSRNRDPSRPRIRDVSRVRDHSRARDPSRIRDHSIIRDQSRHRISSDSHGYNYQHSRPSSSSSIPNAQEISAAFDEKVNRAMQHPSLGGQPTDVGQDEHASRVVTFHYPQDLDGTGADDGDHEKPRQTSTSTTTPPQKSGADHHHNGHQDVAVLPLMTPGSKSTAPGGGSSLVLAPSHQQQEHDNQLQQQQQHQQNLQQHQQLPGSQSESHRPLASRSTPLAIADNFSLDETYKQWLLSSYTQELIENSGDDDVDLAQLANEYYARVLSSNHPLSYGENEEDVHIYVNGTREPAFVMISSTGQTLPLDESNNYGMGMSIYQHLQANQQIKDDSTTTSIHSNSTEDFKPTLLNAPEDSSQKILFPSKPGDDVATSLTPNTVPLSSLVISHSFSPASNVSPSGPSNKHNADSQTGDAADQPANASSAFSTNSQAHHLVTTPVSMDTLSFSLASPTPSSTTAFTSSLSTGAAGLTTLGKTPLTFPSKSPNSFQYPTSSSSVSSCTIAEGDAVQNADIPDRIEMNIRAHKAVDPILSLNFNVSSEAMYQRVLKATREMIISCHNAWAQDYAQHHKMLLQAMGERYETDTKDDTSESADIDDNGMTPPSQSSSQSYTSLPSVITDSSSRIPASASSTSSLPAVSAADLAHSSLKSRAQPKIVRPNHMTGGPSRPPTDDGNDTSDPKFVSILNIPVYHRHIAGVLLDWDFNVFNYSHEELLVFIVQMLCAFDIPYQFHIAPETLARFLCVVHNNYHHSNPYHNFVHGFDVMHTVFLYLTLGSLSLTMSSLERFALLIAAVCHDVDHHLVNNTFHVNARTSFAMLYNDQSLLEHHHTRALFTLLSYPPLNITSKLSNTEFTDFRKVAVLSILATDMQFHFSLIERYDKLVVKLREEKKGAPPPHAIELMSEESPLQSSVSSGGGSGVQPQPGGYVDPLSRRASVSPLTMVINPPSHQYSPDGQNTPPSSSTSTSTGLSNTSDATHPRKYTAVSVANDNMQEPDHMIQTKPSPFTFYPTNLMLTNDLPLFAFVRQLNLTDRVLVLSVILHAADISNPTKPWGTSMAWAEGVCNEFLIQGDLEKSYGFPINPNGQRSEANMAVLNMNFIDIIVAPLYGKLLELSPALAIPFKQMVKNRQKWSTILEDYIQANLDRVKRIQELGDDAKNLPPYVAPIIPKPLDVFTMKQISLTLARPTMLPAPMLRTAPGAKPSIPPPLGGDGASTTSPISPVSSKEPTTDTALASPTGGCKPSPHSVFVHTISSRTGTRSRFPRALLPQASITSTLSHWESEHASWRRREKNFYLNHNIRIRQYLVPPRQYTSTNQLTDDQQE